MSRLSKLAVVLAGYVAALFVSCAAFYSWTQLNTSQGSQGMQAFGDTVMFVGLFCVLSLIPTGLGLYFLRPFEKLWTAFSIASLMFAATGPFAAMTRWVHQSGWTTVELLGFPRIMAAPVLGLGLLICGVIAPTRRSRLALLAAAGIEIAVSAYVFFCLFVLGHWLL
jgi:hypothetical protein